MGLAVEKLIFSVQSLIPFNSLNPVAFPDLFGPRGLFYGKFLALRSIPLLVGWPVHLGGTLKLVEVGGSFVAALGTL